jgi:hypothetical protein
MRLPKMTGRGWAYAGLLLGLSASITANVSSTVLAESEISLGLRVPFAVIWPVLTYIAIEVLTRTDWKRTASHVLIRLVISLPVAAVAAFVSYLHQHELMILAGEPGLAQLVGPLAVDGMLFGMTATLIVTRIKVPAREPESAPVDVDEVLARHGVTEELPIPISPAPISVSAPPAIEPAPRKARSTWDVRAAAELAADGVKAADIVNKVEGISPASAQLFVKVAALLRANPAGEIPAKVTGRSVNPEHVRVMRELISR